MDHQRSRNQHESASHAPSYPYDAQKAFVLMPSPYTVIEAATDQLPVPGAFVDKAFGRSSMPLHVQVSELQCVLPNLLGDSCERISSIKNYACMHSLSV